MLNILLPNVFLWLCALFIKLNDKAVHISNILILQYSTLKQCLLRITKWKYNAMLVLQ